MAMVWASSDSLTPPSRPSMAGLIPMAGRAPANLYPGFAVFMFAVDAMMPPLPSARKADP
jgi:hypothetical protein